MAGSDVTDATGEHDGFVVAAEFGAAGTGHLSLVGAEVAAEGRAAKLVVERGAPQGAVEHDLERRCQPGGPAVIGLPGAHRTRQAQVGHGEADQPCLRLGATAGRSLVADLAAGTGGRAGEGRDGRRVVVRLDLAQQVDLLVALDVAAGARVSKEAATGVAGEHRGVVLVGGEDSGPVPLVRVADHLEQRAVARGAVDFPRGVKNLVPAVLGVGLREHHQLYVVRVTPEFGEGPGEIVDLVLSQR